MVATESGHASRCPDMLNSRFISNFASVLGFFNTLLALCGLLGAAVSPSQGRHPARRHNSGASVDALCSIGTGRRRPPWASSGRRDRAIICATHH